MPIHNLIVVAICAGTLSGCSTVAQDQPGQPEQGIAAIISGEVIRTETVLKRAGVPLVQAEQEAHQKKVAALDQLIAEKLIALEADRRAMRPDELLASEINSKVRPVAEEDITEFYHANKARLNGSEQDVREQIRDLLQADRTRGRRQAFLEELRARTPVEIRLQPPELPPLDISIAGAPLRGNPDATVTIVEFADFHCPFCRQVLPTVEQVLQTYGSRVKLVFKNLPLDDLHPGVRKVHDAAQCAAEQGKFWEYYDAVYAAEPTVEPAKLKELGQPLGLDFKRFTVCVDAEPSSDIVQKDIDEASRLGIAFTPAFFINGRIVSGAQPLENFVRIIDEELK